MDDSIVIKLDSGKELFIKVDLFNGDKEIDIDSLLQIDYSNLAADIATFPVIMNRFGLLLADMDNKVRETELSLRIWQSKIKQEIRNNMVKKKLKPTNDMTDEVMRSDPKYLVLYKRLNRVTKQRDYISNLYWASKAKVDNLNKLSLTIQPGDIDIDNMVSSFNGMKLRTFSKLLK